MGSRKFLIFALVFAVVLSSLALGTSALEVNRELDENLNIRSKPTVVMFPNRLLLQGRTLLVSKSNYLSGLQNIITSSRPITVSYISVKSNEGVVTRNFDTPTAVHFVDSSGLRLVYGQESVYVGNSAENTSLVAYVDGGSIPLPNTTQFEYLEQSPLIDISSFSSVIFSVGSAFLGFVTSSWVILLPLTAFVLIICISAIRRLIKGV